MEEKVKVISYRYENQYKLYNVIANRKLTKEKKEQISNMLEAYESEPPTVELMPKDWVEKFFSNNEVVVMQFDAPTFEVIEREE